MKVPSYPDDVAMALIEEELGRPWHDIYSELTSSPIAAGSLHELLSTLFSQYHLLLTASLFVLQVTGIH